MRGTDRQTGSMFGYVGPEALVPADHPLRAIRLLVTAALERLSGDFDNLYAAGGRDSIAPEKVLRALLPRAFYSVRFERRLMEKVTYNMLFRRFIRLSMDAPVWDMTVFTKNRDRLLRGEVAGKFCAAVLADAQVKSLLPWEHFSVDGKQIEAWASMKVSGRRTAPARAATASATSTVVGRMRPTTATRRTPRPRRLMRGWRRSRTGRQRSSASVFSSPAASQGDSENA
jgi:transposase